MKKILCIAVTAVVCALTAGCSDFLEQPEQAGLTPDVVFEDFNTAESVLAGAYSIMPMGICNQDAGGPWGFRILIYTGNLTNLCDETDTYAIEGVNASVDSYYQKGGLTPNTIMAFREDKWPFYFLAIRNCHLYLANVDQVKKNATPELIARRKAEAKTLLAVQYFEVFKRFGGLPWVPGLIRINDQEAIRERLSIEESVNRMCDYLDEAIAEPNFPMKGTDSDFGRATKAGALLLKARVLMYAASPLYNTVVFPSFGRQELVRYMDISPAAVKARWERAKQAALTAITECNSAGYYLVGEENGVIDPNAADNKNGVNFKKSCDLMTFPSLGNTELVWGVRGDKNGTVYGIQFFAPSQTPNWVSSQNYPTFLALQNLVDQYELASGEMQPANQYSVTKPYDNLEARFKQSVLYHGAVLDKNVNPTRTMDYTLTGANYPTQAQNFTAYNQRKFLDDPHLAFQTGEVYNVFWPYMRLGDLYLIMAEASNEAGDQTNALLWLNKVRQRSGQPKLETTLRWGASAKDIAYLRACIKNERTVEMAFEQQRYFDLKRWLMGYEQPSYRGEGKGSIGGQMYFMSVTGTALAPVFTRTPFEMRSFTDKFYFYPIPQDDINKSGGVLVQNPGW